MKNKVTAAWRIRIRLTALQRRVLLGAIPILAGLLIYFILIQSPSLSLWLLRVLGTHSANSTLTMVFNSLAVIISIFFCFAIGLYVYVDYKVHAQPLRISDPTVSYTLKHHTQVVILPLVRYKKKKISFVILYPLVTILVLGVSTSLSLGKVLAAAPAITTVSADNVTQTSVRLHGNISSSGTTNLTVRGFEYGTTMGYGSQVSDTAPGSYNQVDEWGGYGDGSTNGKFNGPEGIAKDSSGNIYVVDYNNGRVEEFNSSGGFIRKWGQPGPGFLGPYYFNFPHGITIDENDVIYVADSSNQRIQKFNTSGVYQGEFGTFGVAGGQLNGVAGVATDRNGHVFVTDTLNNRIQKFNTDGTFVSAWGRGVQNGAAAYQVCTSGCQAGTAGAGAGMLNYPFGIDTDPAGNVFVTDQYNSRVSKYDNNGTFIASWGWGVADGTSSYQVCTSTCLVGLSGTGDGQFNIPVGITVDENGYVYVSNAGNHRIEKLTNKGNFVSKIGSQGSLDLQNEGITDLFTDSVGGLYYSDEGNQRVVKITPDMSVGNYDLTIRGLTCNTTYHFRAYAQNVAESANGVDQTFTTAGCYAANEFVTSWKTDNPGTSASDQITIPTTGGGYNYNVDWGDGNNSTGVTGDGLHTYASPGTYTVKITGTFPRINFLTGGDRQKILNVLQWGTGAWSSMSYAFYHASNLTVSAGDTPNLSAVSDFTGMFEGASSFNSDIDSWDVSHATSMSTMFKDATSFNQSLNDWDVSHVTDLAFMFFNASAFNGAISYWNTSSVYFMNGMFWGAAAFNQPLNSWNVSHVTDMHVMFTAATSFNQSLNSWDVSHVVDMRSMFEQAISFNGDISSWNVGSVTNMPTMFNGASSFNQPLNGWNVSNVTNMSAMFSGASAFNQPISSWNTSAVTSMSGMFGGATAFDQSINSWNVSGVTSMTGMFAGATAFNQPLNSWTTTNVTSMSQMFFFASSFNQPLGSWNVGNVTSMNGMFEYDSPFNQPLNAWNVAAVTNINNMFEGTSFNQPLNSWNTGSVTSMSGVFLSDTAFNQPLSSWNVGNVTNMNGLFSGATSFNQDLGAWNVHNVTDMSQMFESGSGLSTTNYDATLTGWAGLTLKNNVVLDAGTSTYCNADSQHAVIATNFSWTINDSGLSCPQTDFITTWKTDNPGNIDNKTITIPTNGGGYNYDVNWGDGNTSTGQTGDATHSYATPGTYTVKISGTFPRIFFNNTGDKDKLLTITQWGNTTWANMRFAFAGCSNLTITATDAPDLTVVTDMGSMFAGATSFNSDLSNWDVSHVGSFISTFSEATSFNQPLDGWDMSSAQDTRYMFYDAVSFNQPLNGWNTSGVQSMYFMFNGATSFNQPLDAWNVGSVTDMGFMFANATSFDQPLNSWNVSNVTSMTNMFFGASAFNQPLANWDTSAAIDMSLLFGGATAFNQPLNSWNVSNVSNMYDMFVGATSFDRPLSSWNVSSVTNMGYMFYGATAFDQSLATWNIVNVPDLPGFLGNGAGLSTANYDATLIGWNALTLQNNVTFDAGTSTYCAADVEHAAIIANFGWTINDAGLSCPQDFITTWKTDNPGVSTDHQITITTSGGGYNYAVDWGDASTSSGQTGDATHTYAIPGTYTVKISGTFPRMYFSDVNPSDNQKLLTVEQWGSNPWTSMASAFYGASNLTIPATDVPDLTNVTDMSHMFQYASSFNQHVDTWDVSNVTDMNNMFTNAIAFNQSLSSWNVGQVTDMSQMFAGAASFSQPLNGWNVSNVTSMLGMFAYAFSFNQPLNNWNVANVTNMQTMFLSDSGFNQSLAAWNVSNVTSMLGMFDMGAGLSTANYDATLIGWNALTLQNNVTFDAGTSTYCAADVEHAAIIANFGWTINDAGLSCPAVAPTVSTQAATQIATTGATLNGTISSDGGGTILSRGFDYGLTNSYGSTVGTGTGTGTYFSDVSSLTCNTPYHFRAKASNSAGEGVGSDQTFTTSACVVPPPQTDFSLTKTLTTPGPIKQGNAVTYHMKIKNMGPNNSVFAGGINDILPTQFTYVSSTNSQVLCSDAGLAENTGQYTAHFFTGHHLLQCGTTNNTIPLNVGSSIEFDVNGTASSDFVSGSTTNRSVYMDKDNESVDTNEIFNAITNTIDLYTLSNNNISNQTYSYSPPPPTPDPPPNPPPNPPPVTPTVSYRCDGLTALADTTNTGNTAPLSVAFTQTASATNTTIQKYLFDFGDGTSSDSASAKVNHIYTSPGVYKTTARLKTASGTTAVVTRCSVNVTVNSIALTTIVSSPTSTGGTKPSSNKLTDLAKQSSLDRYNAVKAAAFKRKVTDLSNTVPYYFTSLLLLLALLYAIQAYREYKRTRAMAKLLTRYQQTNLSIQNFLSVTAHYLNTPVAIMQNSIELFMTQKLLPEPLMQRIYANLKLLGKYVAKIQDDSQQALTGTSSQSFVSQNGSPKNLSKQSKKVWLPLLITAVAIAAMDVTFRVLGAYGQSNLRLLNHIIFYSLSAVFLILSAHFQIKQRKLRDEQDTLLANENSLASQKSLLLNEVSTNLAAYQHQLKSESDEFKQIEQTKLFFNGLAMLNKLTKSLGNVQRFSKVQEDAPLQTISNVVAIAQNDLSTQISQKNIKIDTSIPKGLSLQADPDEATFILSSLIENAVKFSPTNGVVSVSASQARGGIKIEVTDNGPGIPEAKLNQLFQPFNRATAAETYDYEGLGLGLYTNKILVGKLGGSLQINNQPKGGLRAVVILPSANRVASGQVSTIFQPQTV